MIAEELAERLMGEGLITLAAAAKLFGQRPNASTVWRWVKSGSKGVRLEAVPCGGRYYTSRAAVLRFIAAQAGPGPSPATEPSSRERQESIRRAKEILDSAGIV